jgi:hypothetical protein
MRSWESEHWETVSYALPVTAQSGTGTIARCSWGIVETAEREPGMAPRPGSRGVVECRWLLVHAVVAG